MPTGAATWRRAGVIAGYERNVATNTMLGKSGIEVVITAGSRTGPRPRDRGA
jgi:hypothetical protein